VKVNVLVTVIVASSLWRWRSGSSATSWTRSYHKCPTTTQPSLGMGQYRACVRYSEGDHRRRVPAHARSLPLPVPEAPRGWDPPERAGAGGRMGPRR